MPGAIPVLRVRDILLVSVQVELRDTIATSFQEDILVTIEKTGARGLLVDVSAIEVLDSYVARVLAETGQMAKLMGTDTVLVGIRPEVAATLVRMGYTMKGVRTALNVDEGMAMLDPRPN
jgi:rsbT antagonist protein RsbS